MITLLSLHSPVPRVKVMLNDLVETAQLLAPANDYITVLQDRIAWVSTMVGEANVEDKVPSLNMTKERSSAVLQYLEMLKKICRDQFTTMASFCCSKFGTKYSTDQ